MNYNAILATKNGASSIKDCIESLTMQTVPPRAIFVYDDCSKDETPQILDTLEKEISNLYVLHNANEREYNTGYLPTNLNHLLDHAKALGLETVDLLLIMADDVILPGGYCQELIDKLAENHELVIASGNELGKQDYNTPRGAGRFISKRFFDHSCFRGKFVADLTWESSILFEARRLGHDTKIFNEIKFAHVRPLGSKHGFRSYGRAMKQLRYSKLYVIARLARNLVKGNEFSRRYTLKVLIEYLREKPNPNLYPKELTAYLQAAQRKRIKDYLKGKK